MTMVVVTGSADEGVAGSDSGPGGHEEPAHVEPIVGSDVARVTLTEKAAERIDVQTTPVVLAGRNRARLVVPYAALLYDPSGKTWVYTNPDDLVFERAEVTVESIRGDRVFIDRGPQAGTDVVVVGPAELWGAEFGVGH